MTDYTHEPMMEMFIFETEHLIEQLESSILVSEKASCYSEDSINEIFRVMHTIKGSSSMMLLDGISSLTHSIEDLFFYIREESPKKLDCQSLSDLVLESIDFIKLELEKIKRGLKTNGEPSYLIQKFEEFLTQIKEKNPDTKDGIKNEDVHTKKQQYYISSDKTEINAGENHYKVLLFFQDGCEMENIRAYAIIHNLKDIASNCYFTPEDIIDNDDSINIIRQEGFVIHLQTDKEYGEIEKFFTETAFLRDFQISKLDEPMGNFLSKKQILLEEISPSSTVPSTTHQNIISVNVNKLDKLMDLVGEMVISEAMVTQNPDLDGLEIENFRKAARQLRKITGELQDMVMSIRMVPISTTFHKMQRIVRDMCKKLNKDVQLEIVGETTEVDKNIIEYISDPLMHLVRNAIDHGIETKQERIESGKPISGKVTLEAKNVGSDVLVIIKDDGRGLDRNKIIKRAERNNLLSKTPDEMTDKEIFGLILLPGFSTKEQVTEFSGRGVGMDVVTKNIESIGGAVSVESSVDIGTTITLKIPLTLAIIEGMNIQVGASRYTIPMNSIKESFRPRPNDIIKDTENNEMIMVRGQCYPIIRIHELYGVKARRTLLEEGILVMVEHEEKSVCIFADELLGQQQVVVKTLPNYINNIKKIKGLSGCTLLGDGGISLILDVAGLMQEKI